MSTTRDTKIEEFLQAERQVLAGHYIKHEDMKAWLLSWSKECELPPPKCVCGKEHNDEALCRLEDTSVRSATLAKEPK